MCKLAGAGPARCYFPPFVVEQQAQLELHWVEGYRSRSRLREVDEERPISVVHEDVFAVQISMLGRPTDHDLLRFEPLPVKVTKVPGDKVVSPRSRDPDVPNGNAFVWRASGPIASLLLMKSLDYAYS